jgi:hypothetical protein
MALDKASGKALDWALDKASDKASDKVWDKVWDQVWAVAFERSQAGTSATIRYLLCKHPRRSTWHRCNRCHHIAPIGVDKNHDRLLGEAWDLAWALVAELAELADLV